MAQEHATGSAAVRLKQFATPVMYTLGQAARAVGKAKSTIHARYQKRQNLCRSGPQRLGVDRPRRAPSRLSDNARNRFRERSIERVATPQQGHRNGLGTGDRAAAGAPGRQRRHDRGFASTARCQGRGAPEIDNGADRPAAAKKMVAPAIRPRRQRIEQPFDRTSRNLNDVHLGSHACRGRLICQKCL